MHEKIKQGTRSEYAKEWEAKRGVLRHRSSDWTPRFTGHETNSYLVFSLQATENSTTQSRNKNSKKQRVEHVLIPAIGHSPNNPKASSPSSSLPSWLRKYLVQEYGIFSQGCAGREKRAHLLLRRRQKSQKVYKHSQLQQDEAVLRWQPQHGVLHVRHKLLRRRENGDNIINQSIMQIQRRSPLVLHVTTTNTNRNSLSGSGAIQ